LHRVAFRIGEVDGNAIALRAITIADWAEGDVMPLQVSDDRFLVERLDAETEMVEVETAGVRRREAALADFDEVEHAFADAQMRHRELRSIADMLRAQHVAVETAHGVDVADSQNQVVDLANLDRDHRAYPRSAKGSLYHRIVPRRERAMKIWYQSLFDAGRIPA